jgi:hypothetical protein
MWPLKATIFPLKDSLRGDRFLHLHSCEMAMICFRTGQHFSKRLIIMNPGGLYFVIGVLLAFPLISASIALRRWNRKAPSDRNSSPERQRVGLRLLLLQTLVPPLQVLPLLRSVTTIPSQIATASFMLLPVLSLLLGGVSLYFLVRYSRGLARVLLPSLNLFVFTCSAVLLLFAFGPGA